jgi:Thioesterase domain
MLAISERPDITGRITDLSETILARAEGNNMRDPKIPADIYRKLVIKTGLWGGTRSSQGSLLIKVCDGEYPCPVFWCVPDKPGFTSIKRLSNFGRPVYVLPSAGHLTENKCDIVKVLAAHYVTRIREVQPSGPYSLAGYCAGADVIYEIARQLAASGNYVAHLILVDPIPAFEVIGRLNGLAAGFFLKFEPFRHHIRDHIKAIGNLSMRRRLVYISDCLFRNARLFIDVLKGYSRSSGTSDNCRDGGSPIVRRKSYYTFAPQPDQKVTLFPGSRSDYASQTGCYTYAPYPGRVILIYGRNSEYAFQRIFPSYFRSLWEKLALGGFEVHNVPGRHDFFDTNEGSRALSEKLRDVLKN